METQRHAGPPRGRPGHRVPDGGARGRAPPGDPRGNPRGPVAQRQAGERGRRAGPARRARGAARLRGVHAQARPHASPTSSRTPPRCSTRSAPASTCRSASPAAARTRSPAPRSRPGRCLAAASVAGVAPYAAEGLDFLAGMGPENIEEFGLAVRGADALTPFLDEEAQALGAITGEQIVAALGGLISGADAAVLTGEFAADLASGLRGAVRNGIAGWRDDDLAFVADWGFPARRRRGPGGDLAGRPGQHGPVRARPVARRAHPRCPRPPGAGRRPPHHDRHRHRPASSTTCSTWPAAANRQPCGTDSRRRNGPRPVIEAGRKCSPCRVTPGGCPFWGSPARPVPARAVGGTPLASVP